ncbi:MAG: class I SAM-dependent methyltransferase, partial [Candidatus Acidiferrales bacterium]
MSAKVVPPGTRPEGTREEREAARAVRQMFAGIAPRYDFLNHLLSLNRDRAWRRRTARALASRLAGAGSRAIDLCCGTADLALELRRV